jgi:hypothetical protein
MRNLIWTLLATAAAGCGEEVLACPEEAPLTDADLPCDCYGSVVDALSCGELYCSPDGIVGITTTGCTTLSPSE